ncbi:MAG: hypothetical protein GY934_22035 [Gammaproteobacteria bacterium]|nr:hypothetical protein [Gammaproteobacteria bacterium]
MADVLRIAGEGASSGVPAPYLQGQIIPVGNGFGGRVSLGMGSMTRRFSDIVSAAGGPDVSDAQLQSLFLAAAQVAGNSAAQTLNVNFDGLIGPPGIPGRDGVAFRGTSGISGAPGSAGSVGKVVVLSATQQIFKYDGDGTIVAAQTITFTANTDNCTGDYTWVVKSPIGSTVRSFTSLGGTSDQTATLSGTDFDGWSQANAEITVTRNGITDTLYIYKIQEGTDVAVAFLTNQNHSFPATNGGVASDYAGGVSEIRAYIGTTQIDYHASNNSTYSLGTLVHSPTSKITITESTVSSQRRLTPSAFDNATDTVSITVPVNIRDSAGTVTALSLTQTYGKNKTGEDAFDDIDIPIPYDGWEGAFTDDDPDPGKVSWTSFKLKYKGVERTISADAAGSSNAYFYWDVNSSPTTILTTATRSNAVGVGKFPVGHNDGGTFYPSQFMKMITAGFISVADLAALNITVGNADIDNLAVRTAHIQLLNVTTAVIDNSSVTNPKLDDDAVAITTTSTVGSTAMGAGYTTTATLSHPSGGDNVDISGQVTVTVGAGAGNATYYLEVTYEGTIVLFENWVQGNGTTIIRPLNCTAIPSGSASHTCLVRGKIVGGALTVNFDTSTLVCREVII